MLSSTIHSSLIRDPEVLHERQSKMSDNAKAISVLTVNTDRYGGRIVFAAIMQYQPMQQESGTLAGSFFLAS